MIHRLARIGLAAAIVGVCVLTAISLAARVWWIADLVNQFRLQYAAVALVALVACVLCRLRAPGLAALLALAVNLVAIVPTLRQQTPPLASASQAPRLALKVVFANVWFRNQSLGAVSDFIERENPDVIVLAEVSQRIDRALAKLGARYPNRYSTGRRGRTGLLLLSRWPVLQARGIDLARTMDPTIAATLDVAGRSLHIVGAHPTWPIGEINSTRRNGELASIATLVRGLDGPVVVIGDFNATAYSPHLQDLIASSGLRLDRLEGGWQPTWPTQFPAIGIRIDHALTSRDIEVRRFRRGPYIGSDHWPLVLDIAL